MRTRSMWRQTMGLASGQSAFDASDQPANPFLSTDCSAWFVDPAPYTVRVKIASQGSAEAAEADTPAPSASLTPTRQSGSAVGTPGTSVYAAYLPMSAGPQIDLDPGDHTDRIGPVGGELALHPTDPGNPGSYRTFSYWNYSESGSGGEIRGAFGGSIANPTGPTFVVNVNNAKKQTDSHAAVLLGGQIAVVWDSLDDDFSDQIVRGRVINTDGSASGKSEFQLNKSQDNSKYFGAQVAALNNGGLVAFWGEEGGTYRVGSRVFDSSGNAVTSDLDIGIGKNHQFNTSDVIGLDEGGFMVTFVDYDNSNVGHGYIAVYNDAYQKILGQLSLANTAQIAFGSLQAAQSNGTTLLVWNNGGTVYTQRYIAGGLTAQKTIASGANLSNPNFLSPVAVTALSSGLFAVVWMSSIFQIVAQLVSPDGDLVGSQTVVASSTSGSDTYETLSLSATSDNKYIVSYSARIGLNYDFRSTVMSVNTTLRAGSDNGETIDNLAGPTVVLARGGSDSITGSTGFDYIFAGDGDDVIRNQPAGIAGTVGDAIDGGAGTDWAILDLSGTGSGASINLSSGATQDYGFGSLTSIERLSFNGGSGADSVTGGNLDDSLIGNVGNDTLSGGRGNDTLDGGPGNDTLAGGDGNDILIDAAGTNQVDGGNGADLFVARAEMARFQMGNTSGAGQATLVSPDAVDVLTQVEEIVFTDQSLVIGAMLLTSNAYGAATNVATTSLARLDNETAIVISTATPLFEHGVISGGGTMTIGQGASVTYDAAQTYTGATTVSGRLVIAGGGALGSSLNVTVTGGGIFNVANAAAAVTIKALQIDPGAAVRLGNNTLTVTDGLFRAGTVGSQQSGILRSLGQTVAGALDIEGTATWRNQGTVVQNLGTVTIGTIAGQAARLANVGGTYLLEQGFGIGVGPGGGIFNNGGGGTLEKTNDAATATVAANFANLSGVAARIAVDGGTLRFAGANNSVVNQAVSGAGTFAIAGGGISTIDAATTIDSAGWTLADAGTVVSLAGSMTYAGRFSLTDTATMNLGATTLTLNGSASLASTSTGNPTVLGTGKLILGGTASIGVLTLGGSMLMRNNGTVTQTGTLLLGDSSGGAAQITNAPGKTWTIQGDVGVAAGNAAATFNNAGTLTKASGSGTSAVGVNVTNLAGTAGTISVDSGTLSFTGASNTFVADAITGVGTFAIGGGGASTIGAGTTIATAAWSIAKACTTVNLGESLTYAGSFSDTNATTLNLGANVLTLTGKVGFNVGPAGSPLVNGPGSLILNGAASIAGLSIGGSAVVRANGTVDQTGAVTLGDRSGGAARLAIGTGATWTLDGDVGIAAGSTAALLNIGGGTLLKSAGSGTRSVVSPNIVNLSTTKGTIEVAAGKLELGGTLDGALGLRIGTGATLLLDKAAGGDTTVDFSGTGGTLQLNDAASFDGILTGFGIGDSLDLRNVPNDATHTPSLTYSGTAALGILKVVDGATVAQLAVLGAYSQAKFHLASDNHGGSLVTYG